MNYVQCLKNWEISWIFPGNFVLRSSLTWQMERKHWPTVFRSFFDSFCPFFWLISVFFEFFCQYFQHYPNCFQFSANNIPHCASNDFAHPLVNVLLPLPSLVNGGSFSPHNSCQLLRFKNWVLNLRWQGWSEPCLTTGSSLLFVIKVHKYIYI